MAHAEPRLAASAVRLLARRSPGWRTACAAWLLPSLLLGPVRTTHAQDVRPGRVPVLTRHSGVIRMQSWNKGFVFGNWVGPHQKSTTVGVGDWIELSGSGAQADIVFPDLTTILMRKAAEIQILKLGGKEHEIAILDGISLDVTLSETAVTLRLPGDRALRWRGGARQKVDLMIQFDAHFDRIRVRHARGESLEVLKGERVVRMLESGQRVDFQMVLPEPTPTGGVHELNRRFVFQADGRRFEIPPGMLYQVEGNRIFFRRDPVLGAAFGLLRIDDEVLVVGPGTVAEVILPPASE